MNYECFDMRFGLARALSRGAHTHSLSHTHTHAHIVSRTHTLSHARPLPHTQTLSLSHTHSFSLSHTHSLSLSLTHVDGIVPYSHMSSKVRPACSLDNSRETRVRQDKGWLIQMDESPRASFSLLISCP